MAVYHEQGTYSAKIGLAALDKSSKGNPQIILTLELTGFHTEDKIVPPTTSRFPPRIFLTLTEATMGTEAQPGWVAETLAHIGFNGDFGAIASLEGKTVQVRCSTTQGLDGAEREQWDIDRPQQARTYATPEKKTLRDLNSKFGKIVKAAASKPPTAPNGQQTATETPAADNLPF